MNGSRKCGIYTMEFYSAMRNNDTMWFEDKWMQLDDIMISKPGSERQRPHVFSHTWKIDPKDKHTHKNKQDHTQTQMYKMFIIVELFYGTQGKRERKRMIEY
jgi:hypothetical protein